MSFSRSLVITYSGQGRTFDSNCISERYIFLIVVNSFLIAFSSARLTSNSTVGTLHLYRESVLHFIVSASRAFSLWFLTSTMFSRTTINDVRIENQIADAIVYRIFRAHKNGTPWKCCVVIPLLPGFTYPVDHSDASSVSKSRFNLTCLMSTPGSDNPRMSEQDHLSRSRFNLCTPAQGRHQCD